MCSISSRDRVSLSAFFNRLPTQFMTEVVEQKEKDSLCDVCVHGKLSVSDEVISTRVCESCTTKCRELLDQCVADSKRNKIRHDELTELNTELVNAQSEEDRLVEKQKRVSATIYNTTQKIHALKLDAAVNKINRLYPQYANRESIEICHKCHQKSITGFASNKKCKNGHLWRYCVHSGDYIGVRVGFNGSYSQYDFDQEDLAVS